MGPAKFLDTEAASEYVDFKPATLNRWRSQGFGPKFIRICGRIRYREQDLDEWLSSFTPVGTTAEAKAQLSR
jgi:predicted DNA-binding transcriptional regulator AlpA